MWEVWPECRIQSPPKNSWPLYPNPEEVISVLWPQRVTHGLLPVALFSRAASLQCVHPLLPGSRCPVLHLQRHPDSAPQAGELPSSAAQERPPAAPPGPHLPPENCHHVPSHSDQIPLYLQPQGLRQHFPGESDISETPLEAWQWPCSLHPWPNSLTKAEFLWDDEHISKQSTVGSVWVYSTEQSSGASLVTQW